MLTVKFDAFIRSSNPTFHCNVILKFSIEVDPKRSQAK